MLGRHVIGYLPSLVVPALCSLAAILAFTRLLTPAEYGYYSLAISGMMLINAVCFYWLQAALPRLMPEVAREGNAAALRATAYRAFFVISAVLLLLTLGTHFFLAHSTVLWFAVGLAIARALLNVNLAWHRAALAYRRYNLLECGAALIGITLGIALVLRHPDATSALTGLVGGMGVMLLVDRAKFGTSRATHSVVPSPLRGGLGRGARGEAGTQFHAPLPPLPAGGRERRSQPQGQQTLLLTHMLRFGLPLMLSYGLAFVIASSDRFFIEYFLGAHDVGIYAAGYGLIDRIGQMAFMAVALPAFSLTIHRLEHEGIDAARAQTYRNGIGILAFGLPVCVGLALTAPHLAAVLIGSEFRIGALQVMPYIAASALLNGLTTHYFDHAFHFGKKTRRLIVTYAAAAALNLLLNLLLIPHYGIMGAAYATLASYILLLALSITFGRSSFPIHFPFVPALKITAATALMVLVLSAISFPLTFWGLAGMVGTGTVLYVAAILALRVANLQTIARAAR